MAFGGYDIDVDAAQGVVSTTRSTFTVLEGIENSIESDGEAAATATKEDDINQAMADVFNNFLRPFVVTMVNSGKHVFDSTDTVITTYDNADSDISQQSSAQATMVDDVAGMGDLPEYSSTSDTGGGGRPEAPDGGYDW